MIHPQTRAEKDEIERNERKIKEVRDCCRRFYVTAISEMQKRFYFDDSVYDLTEILLPNNARNLVPSSLVSVFARLPVLKQHCDLQKADSGWREAARLRPEVFGCETSDEIKKMCPVKYWNAVSRLDVVPLQPRRL